MQNGIADLRKRFNEESDKGSQLFKVRVFHAGQDATLESMDLQRGDVLTEDTDYEIIDSEIRYDPRTDLRFAQVTAMKEVVTATGDPWSELIQTRRIITTIPTWRMQITFTGSTTAKRPERQQTYRDVTGITETFREFGMVAEPEIVNILDVKQATINKTHVTVIFEGHWLVVV